MIRIYITGGLATLLSALLSLGGELPTMLAAISAADPVYEISEKMSDDRKSKFVDVKYDASKKISLFTVEIQINENSIPSRNSPVALLISNAGVKKALKFSFVEQSSAFLVLKIENPKARSETRYLFIDHRGEVSFPFLLKD